MFSSKLPVKAISNMRATKDLLKNKSVEDIFVGTQKLVDLSLSDQDMPQPIVPQPISQEVMVSPVQNQQPNKEPAKTNPISGPSKSVVPPVTLPSSLNQVAQTQQKTEAKVVSKQLIRQKYISSVSNSDKKSTSFVVSNTKSSNVSFCKKYQIKRKDIEDDCEVISTKAPNYLQNKIDKSKYTAGSKSARCSPVAFSYSKSTNSLNKFFNKTPRKQEEIKEIKKEDFFNRLTQSVSPIFDKITSEKKQIDDTRRYKRFISKSFSKANQKKILSMYNNSNRNITPEIIRRMDKLIGQKKDLVDSQQQKTDDQIKDKLKVKLVCKRNEKSNAQVKTHIEPIIIKLCFDDNGDIIQNQNSNNEEILVNAELTPKNDSIHNLTCDVPKLNLGMLGAEIEKREENLNCEMQNTSETPKMTKRRSNSEEKLYLLRNRSHRNNQIKSSDKLNYFKLSYFDSKDVKCITARKYSHESVGADDSFGNMKKKFRAKQIAKMKSQLPQSHLPTNKPKDNVKHDSLVERLNAIKISDDTEKQIQEPIEIQFSQPKFLDIEIPEDSLEELARIDAELENDNTEDFIFEENNLFKYEDPILPNIKDGFEYTLLVDLDETLIHFNEEEEFYLTRPGVPFFLQELSKYYEIVIFTAALKDYADVIIDQIDIYKSITHRLYRHHCTLEGEFHIKDLSKIDRDINKTIIIDNLAESFSRQPENGILVKDWFDDMEDTELTMLVPFLKTLVVNKSQDVREVIKMVLNY